MLLITLVYGCSAQRQIHNVAISRAEYYSEKTEVCSKAVLRLLIKLSGRFAEVKYLLFFGLTSIRWR